MQGITLATADAGLVDTTRRGVLQAALKGEILDQHSAAYDDARSIWNAMIDRKPDLIIRCRDEADVVHAVNFARDHGLLVAVRGGGHNIAGSAVCDGGVVIDLSQMKDVRVDAAARQARFGPGATLADVDKATQAFGLAVPTGINSTTGIAGLTLGGGFGWLTRKYGLTIDSLIAADVVTADGELRRASATENQDLFWALRGGGGNFGVVTSFEFQLSPVGPEVYSGLIVHPIADAPAVLKAYRQAIAAAPDELSCWTVMRQAPPLPFLSADWHGKEVLVLALCYCGNVENGEQATARLRSIGNPIASHLGPNPFAGWQQAFDPLLTPGARNYWKSHDVAELSDAAIEILVPAIANLPGPECEVFTADVSGAAARIGADATAFPQRRPHFVMNVHARWRDAGMDQTCIGWARKLFEAMSPHATGTAYVNFMPGDESERVEAAYGANFERLAQIKRRYDPSNLFRMNQNVKPSDRSPAS
ncbi:MAG TPA: FAD-binding oxidoreductase [Roseiarcus sp.]